MTEVFLSNLTLVYWLLGLVGGGLVLTLGCYQYRRRWLRIEKQITFLKQEITALARGSVGVGKRLAKVDSEQQGLKQRQRALENEGQQPSYEQACKLIELGASADELMAHCGFPRGEAELLISLAKKKKSRSHMRSVL